MTPPATDLHLIIDNNELLPRVIAFLRSVGTDDVLAELAQMSQTSNDGNWISAEQHLRAGLIAALEASPRGETGADIASIVTAIDQATMVRALSDHRAVSSSHQVKRIVSGPTQTCEILCSTISMHGRGTLAIINLTLSMRGSSLATTFGIWSSDSVSLARTLFNADDSTLKLQNFEPDVPIYLMETMAKINASAISRLSQWEPETLETSLALVANDISIALDGSPTIILCRGGSFPTGRRNGNLSANTPLNTCQAQWAAG